MKQAPAPSTMRGFATCAFAVTAPVMSALALCMAGCPSSSPQGDESGPLASIARDEMPTDVISPAARDLERLGPALVVEDGRVMFPQRCTPETNLSGAELRARITAALGSGPLFLLTASGAIGVVPKAPVCVVGSCETSYVGVELQGAEGDGLLIPASVERSGAVLTVASAAPPAPLECAGCRSWRASGDDEVWVQSRGKQAWRLITSDLIPTGWAPFPVTPADGAPQPLAVFESPDYRVAWRLGDGEGSPKRSAGWLSYRQTVDGRAVYKVGVRYAGAGGQTCAPKE